MKNKILFVSCLLLILILSACAPAATPIVVQESTEAPTQAQPAANVLFQIVKADGTKFDVTLDAVKALPLAQLSVEGKMEEGPYLLDVLALAGVKEFTEITLTGSSNPVTLRFAQVDNNTILDFNNHGAMKLATTYIPKPQWTKDVAEITVK
ncbi:MAG: hypothetical protein HZB50_14730 [Chloroflexi bacterium]|nr:hypothetical protein [Chloroflexota bacterium]